MCNIERRLEAKDTNVYTKVLMIHSLQLKAV